MKILVTAAVLMLASAGLSAQTKTESTNSTTDKKIVHRDLAAREAQSGQASGKAAEVKSPRDSATGQASGKQANEVKAPRDAATGQASGKRQHQPLKTEEKNQSPLYDDKGHEGVNPLYEGKK